MASVLVPHFNLPFRYGADKHAVVVQQDTEDDIVNCVHAAVRTIKGTRFYVPNFGIDDPVFSVAPLDLGTINQQIVDSEPRADLILTQTISQLVDTLRVGVDARE